MRQLFEGTACMQTCFKVRVVNLDAVYVFQTRICRICS